MKGAKRVFIMAAETDDVDAKDEENILYDLAILAEWKFDNETFVSQITYNFCRKIMQDHVPRTGLKLDFCFLNKLFHFSFGFVYCSPFLQ